MYNKLEQPIISLTVALYMLSLYSDDRSHFKNNNILHKMTCGLISMWLNAGKITKKDKHRTATGWLWLLNRGNHLIR